MSVRRRAAAAGSKDPKLAAAASCRQPGLTNKCCSMELIVESIARVTLIYCIIPLSVNGLEASLPIFLPAKNIHNTGNDNVYCVSALIKIWSRLLPLFCQFFMFELGTFLPTWSRLALACYLEVVGCYYRVCFASQDSSWELTSCTLKLTVTVQHTHTRTQLPN